MSKKITLSLMNGALTRLISLRIVLLNLFLFIACLSLALFALYYGKSAIDWNIFWKVLHGGSDHTLSIIIWQWRMPRLLVALIAGIALALSGALFQSVLHNPLGSPDIIGFNSGAWTGVLITLILFNAGYYLMIAGALIGGSLTALSIYLLARHHGISGYRLIIIGIAISALLTAFNTWLSLTGSLDKVISATIWFNGSLNGMSWQRALPLLMTMPLFLLLMFHHARILPIIELGDDKAATLGCSIQYSRTLLLFSGVLLTASVTATTGPISFISLAAPQIARRLTNANHIPLFTSALVGALLLLGSDLIAQHLFDKTQLSVGAVTVSVGGFYLIWLLTYQFNQRELL